MRQEDIHRLKQRNEEEQWRAIQALQKRLDYIEPREEQGSEVLSLFAYGEIYVHNNGVAQSIATGAAYTKSTAWTTDGQERNCTNDAANDKITLTETGIYKVSCNASAKSGTANINLLGAIFLNAVEQDQIHFRRKISTANDEGSMAMNGFIDVTTAPWDLDLRLRHDNAGAVNITITYANMNVIYLGPT